jgi:N6-adenosine-specific RNA methylase IME4
MQPHIDTDKKYKVIVSDSPWRYGNKYLTGNNRTSSGMTGAASKYPTLDLEEIKQLNVPDIADEGGCVLFLWATTPLLQNGFDVMSAYGFQYKTCLIWCKTNWLGLGKWFRTNTEFCLIGIKGKIKPFYQQTPNIIYAQPTRHSRKPPEFWDKIEPAIVDLEPRIELFAREMREGWDHFGLEV